MNKVFSFRTFLGATRFCENLAASKTHIQINFDEKDNISDFAAVCDKANGIKKALLDENSIELHISIKEKYEKLALLFKNIPKLAPPPLIFLYNLGDKSLLEVHF